MEIEYCENQRTMKSTWTRELTDHVMVNLDNIMVTARMNLSLYFYDASSVPADTLRYITTNATYVGNVHNRIL